MILGIRIFLFSTNVSSEIIEVMKMEWIQNVDEREIHLYFEKYKAIHIGTKAQYIAPCWIGIDCEMWKPKQSLGAIAAADFPNGVFTQTWGGANRFVCHVELLSLVQWMKSTTVPGEFCWPIGSCSYSPGIERERAGRQTNYTLRLERGAGMPWFDSGGYTIAVPEELDCRVVHNAYKNYGYYESVGNVLQVVEAVWTANTVGVHFEQQDYDTQPPWTPSGGEALVANNGNLEQVPRCGEVPVYNHRGCSVGCGG